MSQLILNGSIHRLENDTHIPLLVIEVQTGSYLGEDDIVRMMISTRSYPGPLAIVMSHLNKQIH